MTLGGDPVHVSVGATRIPWGMPEYDYMGWWMGKPVEVIKGPVTGLPIPADAEIAFEGEMLPPEVDSRVEGPFSEWSGHYSPAKPEAAFKVKAILHRNDPIILAMLPFLRSGILTGWDHLLKAAHVWNHLDKIVPGVKGVWNHIEFGAAHALAISIEQKYGGHAKQVALAALAIKAITGSILSLWMMILIPRILKRSCGQSGCGVTPNLGILSRIVGVAVWTHYFLLRREKLKISLIQQ